MKISHADYEVCRANPRQWVAAKFASTGGGFSYGYGQALRGAIFSLHAANSSAEGRVYLNEKMKKFKNEERIADCKRAFREYSKWVSDSGVVVAACRVRLNQLLYRDISLGGEISRVDIDLQNDNYVAVLLGSRSPSWRNELRFPIIQYAIAEQFKRNVALVRVGYQEMNGANLETTQFAVDDIEEAVEEAKQVGRVVHTEIARLGHSL